MESPFHILLIEEDTDQIEHLSTLIRGVADCKLDVMSRMENSVDWIARSNYHLVVIDTSSSDAPVPQGSAPSRKMTGVSMLEQIKRLSPFTSVVLVSEFAAVEQAVAAIRLGAEDYFKKPFNPEAFQLAVRRGLDRKQVYETDTGVTGFLNLISSCQMISASLEQKKIFEIIQSYIARELKMTHTAIYSLDGADPFRVDDANSNAKQDRAMEEVLEIALVSTNPLAKMQEAGEVFRFVDRGQLTPGLFVFRFQCAGKEDYFCVGLSPERPSSLESFESRIRMMKAQIEVTGKNIERYLGVQHLVYVDDATGLYNTRYLNYILEREIAQSQASGKPFAVLFMDADKFKTMNDSHGHLMGTKLLNELGHQLKKLVREKDTVFRYGGDEFVAVLTHSDLATASAVAERIRSTVEKFKFLSKEGLNLHFTVSIGVALFPDHAGSKKEIIEAADRAMYASKKRTRNSVTIASLPIQEASGG